MKTSLLTIVTRIRRLVAQCVPRWGGSSEGNDKDARVLKLVQEMLFWPYLHPGTDNIQDLAIKWQLYLDRVLGEEDRGRLSNSDAHLLAEYWKEVIANAPQLPIVSTYFHFWNPLTSLRATSPLHFPPIVSDPLDPYDPKQVELGLGFVLYTELDRVARERTPPLFTANQLLQRLVRPPAYSIHWSCESMPGFDVGQIYVNEKESEYFLSAIPDRLEWNSVASADSKLERDARMRSVAKRLFGAFVSLNRKIESDTVESVERALSVLRRAENCRIDQKWQIERKHAAFFLFALAVNRKNLSCEHLYNFPLSVGKGCSIVSISTSRELSLEEYTVANEIAMAVLYPIMLGSFFNAVGQVESYVYRDWRHELDTPVRMLSGVLSTLEQMLGNEDFNRAEAARLLQEGRRSFVRVANRVRDRVYAVRDSRHQPPQQTVPLGKVLQRAFCEVQSIISIEDPWVKDIMKLEEVSPDSIPFAPVSQLLARYQSASESTDGNEILRRIVAHYFAPSLLEEPHSTVAIGPLETVLSNLIRNAVSHCHWPELLRHDPSELSLIRMEVFRTGGDARQCAIHISNPLAPEVAENYSNGAEAPPCYYETWWRGLESVGNVGSWGGRHTIDAMRRLHRDDPEVLRRLLVTRCDSMFCVELNLPMN